MDAHREADHRKVGRRRAYLQLSSKGTATWVFRYRIAGRQRELTLGNYPDLGLANARSAACAARVKVDQGVDVAGEKRKAKADAFRNGTFRESAEDYFRRSAAALATSSHDEVRRYLDKDINPRLGHLVPSEIDGSDIVTMVERIAARSDSVARHAFARVSLIFAHGVAKHLVKGNPCAGLKLSAILGPQEAGA
jgi:hypothetical protein